MKKRKKRKTVPLHHKKEKFSHVSLKASSHFTSRRESTSDALLQIPYKIQGVRH